MVAFCKAMDEYQKKHYPRLPSLSVAWWPGCLTFAKGAKLVFKANKGFCDLQFGNTSMDELYPKVQGMLTDRMHIVKAAKSASVRIEIKPIDFEKDFSLYVEEVDEALEALLALYDLSKEI